MLGTLDVFFAIGTQPVLIKFDNFCAFVAPLPQPADVYCKRILSPIPAAALLVYVTVIVLDVTLPESIVPVDPTVPVGVDHK